MQWQVGACRVAAEEVGDVAVVRVSGLIRLTDHGVSLLALERWLGSILAVGVVLDTRAAMPMFGVEELRAASFRLLPPKAHILKIPLAMVVPEAAAKAAAEHCLLMGALGLCRGVAFDLPAGLAWVRRQVEVQTEWDQLLGRQRQSATREDDTPVPSPR
jgi:hypothetical protein